MSASQMRSMLRFSKSRTCAAFDQRRSDPEAGPALATLGEVAMTTVCVVASFLPSPRRDAAHNGRHSSRRGSDA